MDHGRSSGGYRRQTVECLPIKRKMFYKEHYNDFVTTKEKGIEAKKEMIIYY